MCGGVYVQYFKINLFILWCPLFFENYLNPQVRINKIVDKHTVDYHPSPSQLILRIHSLIFLWTPKRFISPESFLNFFLNLFIPPWLRKSFKFIVLRSLQIHLWVKKIECFNFYSCPQAKLAPKFLWLFPQADGNCTFLSNSVFEDIFPEKEGGRRLWSWKNYQISQRYRSQVLINSTVFATFSYLVYVLLCNNLASSMLKCESSLT